MLPNTFLSYDAALVTLISFKDLSFCSSMHGAFLATLHFVVGPELWNFVSSSMYLRTSQKEALEMMSFLL